jgi:FKBP-type peptidyl-prolyl cis-trans isomerase FkpA
MVRKNSQTILVLIAVFLVVSLVSCDPSKKLEREENSKIQEYLSNNTNLNYIKKASGLYFLEIQAGTGEFAVKHDTAYIKYTGKLLDGTVFDTNVGTTDTLIVPVDEGWLISGIDEGITYMKMGGKAILLLPSSLAYGRSGYYYIQGYTPLLFDLELVRVKQGPRK